VIAAIGMRLGRTPVRLEGRNGTRKSTLLRIIAGVSVPMMAARRGGG
jgi:ABC-type transport system involved in cytochrome c biogenesis ATPase subunit